MASNGITGHPHHEHGGKDASASLLTEVKNPSNRSNTPPSYDPGRELGDGDKVVFWGVRWLRDPLIIAVLFSCGVVSAVGHHLFYSRFDGKRPLNNDQKSYIIVIGNGLVFMTFWFLRVACKMSYSQYMWTTMKKKSLRIMTLDKLFTLTSDPRGFLNWEILFKAKVCTVIALIIW